LVWSCPVVGRRPTENNHHNLKIALVLVFALGVVVVEAMSWSVVVGTVGTEAEN